VAALAASGAGLVHCPVSNLFGGDIAGTSQWMQYGLTAGIGTDFARTDLWDAVRLAYLLLRRQAGPTASALGIFGWATAGGQHAYGYSDRGRVDPGAAADLVLLDMTRLRPAVDRADLSTATYAVLADTRPSFSRGPFGDVRRVLVSLADLATENSVTRGRLLWVAAIMSSSQNDFDACAALSEESLRIGTAARDLELVGWALIASHTPFCAANPAAAQEYLESALSLARLMRLDQVELVVHNALAAVLTAAGEIDRAIALGEHGVALSVARGESWCRGYQLDFLARAYWLRGDQEKAEVLAREAAVHKYAVDDRNGLTMVLETLASMAAEGGRPERAAMILETVRKRAVETVDELTTQEAQVARLAAQGRTNPEIAALLFISPHRRVPPAQGIPEARY